MYEVALGLRAVLERPVGIADDPGDIGPREPGPMVRNNQPNFRVIFWRDTLSNDQRQRVTQWRAQYQGRYLRDFGEGPQDFDRSNVIVLVGENGGVNSRFEQELLRMAAGPQGRQRFHGKQILLLNCSPQSMVRVVQALAQAGAQVQFAFGGAGQIKQVDLNNALVFLEELDRTLRQLDPTRRERVTLHEALEAVQAELRRTDLPDRVRNGLRDMLGGAVYRISRSLWTP